MEVHAMDIEMTKTNHPDSSNRHHHKQQQQAIDNLTETTKETTIREELFAEFYLNCTLHGFRYLWVGSKTRRFFWSLVIFSVLGFCVVLFHQLFTDFLDRKTTISRKIIAVDKMTFPSVIICPYRSVSKKKLKNLPANITESTFSAFFENATNLNDSTNSIIFQTLRDHNITSYEQFLHLYLATIDDYANSDVTRVLRSMKLHAGSSSVWCEFFGQPCPRAYIHHTELRPHTWCSTFNAYSGQTDQNPLVVDPNFRDGFSMFLDVSGMFDPRTLHNGFSVSVSSYQSYFNFHKGTKFFHLSPGYTTRILLKEKTVELLPEPYSTKCADSEFKILSKRPYRREWCIIDCLAYELHAKIGCLGNDTLALTTGIQACSIEQMQNYFQSRDSIIKRKYTFCHKQCPIACRHTKYHIVRREIRLGNDELYRKLRRKVPGWENKSLSSISYYIRENIVELDIAFYDNKIFEETTNAAVSWTTLIATIGGCVGLGLGFSFITLIESLFFLFDYVTSIFKTKTTVNGVKSY